MTRIIIEPLFQKAVLIAIFHPLNEVCRKKLIDNKTILNNSNNKNNNNDNNDFFANKFNTENDWLLSYSVYREKIQRICNVNFLGNSNNNVDDFTLKNQRIVLLSIYLQNILLFNLMQKLSFNQDKNNHHNANWNTNDCEDYHTDENHEGFENQFEEHLDLENFLTLLNSMFFIPPVFLMNNKNDNSVVNYNESFYLTFKRNSENNKFIDRIKENYNFLSDKANVEDNGINIKVEENNDKINNNNAEKSNFENDNNDNNYNKYKNIENANNENNIGNNNNGEKNVNIYNTNGKNDANNNFLISYDKNSNNVENYNDENNFNENSNVVKNFNENSNVVKNFYENNSVISDNMVADNSNEYDDIKNNHDENNNIKNNNNNVNNESKECFDSSLEHEVIVKKKMKFNRTSYGTRAEQVIFSRMQDEVDYNELINNNADMCSIDVLNTLFEKVILRNVNIEKNKNKNDDHESESNTIENKEVKFLSITELHFDLLNNADKFPLITVQVFY
jgi:hypothetical protein